MHKRAFMLGDSFIWGTEHTAPDGKICNFPPRKYNRKDPKDQQFSELPSEKTWPYFIDDWQETVNLADTGHGIDLVRQRFTHEIFPVLEPDDTVFVYLPTLYRKKYANNIVRLMNDIRPGGVDRLINNNEKNWLLDHSHQLKFNNNWYDVFMDTQVQDAHYFTDRENRSAEFLRNLNDVEKKQAFLYITSIFDLTINSTDNMIFDVADCIITIDSMAQAKGCSNVFYAIETNGFSEKIRDFVMKTVGETKQRVICWHWVNRMLKMRKEYKKTEKEWICPDGHFTELAHQMFANEIKDDINRLRKE